AARTAGSSAARATGSSAARATGSSAARTAGSSAARATGSPAARATGSSAARATARAAADCVPSVRSALVAGQGRVEIAARGADQHHHAERKPPHGRLPATPIQLPPGAINTTG
ncbi:MAG: hypothetical protein H6Q89_5102, partial [Myxococcaceae bacterium]|nr:hypothetical protein [Myxococcaceae bacterium]